MSDAKSIVEAVAYRELAAAIAGATVYQDAPSDAHGDLVIIGDLKSFRPSLKETGGDRRVEISILSLVIAEERAPLLALQAQIEAILDEQDFELDGWTVAFLSRMTTPCSTRTAPAIPASPVSS